MTSTRLERVLVRFAAAERRKTVASGVSPGLTIVHFQSQAAERRQKNCDSVETSVAPPGLDINFVIVARTPGSRPRLHSFAAPRLDSAAGLARFSMFIRSVARDLAGGRDDRAVKGALNRRPAVPRDTAHRQKCLCYRETISGSSFWRSRQPPERGEIGLPTTATKPFYINNLRPRDARHKLLARGFHNSLNDHDGKCAIRHSPSSR